MSLPPPIANALIASLESHFECLVRLYNFEPLRGGCINQVYKIETNVGSFCVKYNAAPPPAFFACEAEGLQRLKQSGFPCVPEAVVPPNENFLVLAYLPPAPSSSSLWRSLGENLAFLHKKNTASSFGYDIDNYIGSAPQSNLPRSENWTDFFIARRLEPFLRLTSGKWEKNIYARFEKLFLRLENYFPPVQPALLHGDLWNGNVYFAAPGCAFLIDPAVYYGHPEAELAFTRLFGGFPPDFYASYTSVAPLEPGFQERIPIYNLYPLLVHVYLFGESYQEETIRTLKRFT